MDTWTTFTAMAGDTEIRLDMLDHDGETAGWIVRRACNVHQAFTMPEPDPDGQVLDLLGDGHLVGVFPDVDMAREAIQQHLGITGPTILAPAADPVSLA